MDIQLITTLQAEIKDALDRFQSTGTENFRVEAHEKALQLAQALDRPQDAIMRLSYGSALFMAVKAGIDMDLFSVLAQATKPVSLTELAAPKAADPLLVDECLALSSFLLFLNWRPDWDGNRTHHADSSGWWLRRTVNALRIPGQRNLQRDDPAFLEFLPAVCKTPAFLESLNYRNPDDPLNAPFQYTYNFKPDSFTWLCQNPAALSRFNYLMEAQRADRPFWGDWFPVQERILDHPDLSPDKPLLVDIGGGFGHDLLLFHERFPDAPGQLVLEDLPTVIDDVRESETLKAAGIRTYPYDFFNQMQPAEGARMYYFKHVLHDWSNEKANIIFNNLKPVMKRGYSKIIIEEYIVPDQNAHLIPSLTDLQVMIFCSGLQRTRRRWDDLLTSAGFQVKFWVREGSGLGVIEAELPIGQPDE